jgi:citrate lyase beta subunit
VFPIPRSLLFVPADQSRKLAKAWDSDAGAVIADLEDAVSGRDKARARECLRAQCSRLRATGSLVVRINALETHHARRDLELVRDLPGVEAVLVPKARSVSLRELPSSLPPRLALVETASGVLEAPAIAGAPGIAALMIGTVDLAAELCLPITADYGAFVHARSTVVLASRAAELPAPIDGVWTAVDDHAGLRAEAEHARNLGFGAKACIHPSQIEIIEEVFRPTSNELDWAQRVINQAELAPSLGVATIDGAMVDRAVVERARRIVASTERAPH